MNYGTVIDNTLHPAPRAFMLHGAMVTNPKAEHFAALNEERAKQGLPLYYPISNDPAPTPPDGKVVRFGGYAVMSGWITPQYSFEDAPPPPPRTFYTADVIEALMAEGAWPQIRAWLDQQGMTDMVLATKEFFETDPNFTAAKEAAMTLLGWDAAKVEEVLARAQGGI